jgi:hypothetical protein
LSRERPDTSTTPGSVATRGLAVRERRFPPQRKTWPDCSTLSAFQRRRWTQTTGIQQVRGRRGRIWTPGIPSLIAVGGTRRWLRRVPYDNHPRRHRLASEAPMQRLWADLLAVRGLEPVLHSLVCPRSREAGGLSPKHERARAGSTSTKVVVSSGILLVEER